MAKYRRLHVAHGAHRDHQHFGGRLVLGSKLQPDNLTLVAQARIVEGYQWHTIGVLLSASVVPKLLPTSLGAIWAPRSVRAMCHRMFVVIALGGLVGGQARYSLDLLLNLGIHLSNSSLISPIGLAPSFSHKDLGRKSSHMTAGMASLTLPTSKLAITTTT